MFLILVLLILPFVHCEEISSEPTGNTDPIVEYFLKWKDTLDLYAGLFKAILILIVVFLAGLLSLIVLIAWLLTGMVVKLCKKRKKHDEWDL